MNKLQEKLFEMFCWFHEFCEENDLRYYMLGGTMLGAVRHQGFIPWDDDIDVGMPRRDYERLESLMKEKNNEQYILETPNSPAKEFLYAFSKLYDSKTTVVEKTRWPVKRGVNLDIFPLDGIGNTEIESFKNYKRILLLRNLLLTRVTYIRKGRSILKNVSVLLSRMTRYFFSDKKLLYFTNSVCKKYDFDTCEWCGNLVGAWRQRELMPRNLFGEPRKYLFENKQFYGPEHAEEYLKYLYGNWRKLPPVEQQVSHHEYIYINLNEPYKSVN